MGNCDIGVKTECSLLGEGLVPSPITVVDVSSVSMTFESRAGHPEGAGNLVTFQIYEEAVSGGQTRLSLVVDAVGPYHGLAGLFGPLSRGYAKRRWSHVCSQSKPVAGCMTAFRGRTSLGFRAALAISFLLHGYGITTLAPQNLLRIAIAAGLALVSGVLAFLPVYPLLSIVSTLVLAVGLVFAFFVGL